MKNSAVGIVIFFLALFLYIKFLGPIPFAVNSVQTTKTDLFQVTGQGSATAVPDTATIDFAVTKQAGAVTDAQNQTNTIIQKIMDGLKSLGVSAKDIKTTNYSVNPNYDFTSGQTITGYGVTQNVEVKISPLDKVNKTLDTITANGANIVGQVSFGFTNEKQQQLEDLARQDAVKKAKMQAESLTKATGVMLGPIIDIQENNPQTPIVMPLNAQANSANRDTPTNATPGENTITTSITLSYQLY